MAFKTSSSHALNGSAKSSIKSKSEPFFDSKPSRNHENGDGQHKSIMTEGEENDIILEENDYSIGYFVSDTTTSNPQFTYATIDESIQAHTGRVTLELKEFNRRYSQTPQSTT